MRRKMLKRTCAVVLSMALAVTGVNVDGIYTAAAENRETVQDETKITAEQKEEARKEDEKVREELKKTKEKKEKNEKATVVKELKDFRTSNSTTYLLSDGSRKLEIYGEDIRYKEDGKYVDYDPSLKKISKSETKELAGQKVITDKDAAEDYVYVNTAGDAKHYFPEKLDEDSAVVMVKKNHTISFAPVRKEETVQESLESSENTGSVQESPEGSENTSSFQESSESNENTNSEEEVLKSGKSVETTSKIENVTDEGEQSHSKKASKTTLLWSSVFVTLMAKKYRFMQFELDMVFDTH